MRGVLFASTLLIVSQLTLAADPDKGESVLLHDPLDKGFGSGWKVAKGRWDAHDGSIRGAELKSDMHGAVARHPLAFQNADIRFSFKLDGARQISLSLNGDKGHINRVIIRPNGFSVNKDDQDGKKGPDKGEVLGKCDVKIATGEWHTMLLKLRGSEMSATLDGKETASGKHESINKPRANLGFTVAGETASFKDLKVTEAGNR